MVVPKDSHSVWSRKRLSKMRIKRSSLDLAVEDMLKRRRKGLLGGDSWINRI